MSTYSWPELLKRWERSELLPDQAIGQLLQWGASLSQQVTTQAQQIAALQRQVAQLREQLERMSPKQG